jgi:hypothetical protein
MQVLIRMLGALQDKAKVRRMIEFVTDAEDIA